MTLEELKQQICSHFDETQLIDFLDISMEMLVDALEDYIKEDWKSLERELGQ